MCGYFTLQLFSFGKVDAVVANGVFRAIEILDGGPPNIHHDTAYVVVGVEDDFMLMKEGEGLLF